VVKFTNVRFMKTNRLCSTLALTFLVVCATSAWAQNAPNKQAPARLIDVKKVFPYYDLYLGLPPADRDGFAMVYRLGSRASTQAPTLNYVLGTTRTPIQIAADGRILTMPDATMLANGKIERVAGQPGGSVTLDLNPVVPLGRSISAAAAANPLNDYAAAIRRAGPLSLVAPRLSAVRFVGGAGGEAILSDGRRVALPAAPEGGVLFTPSAPSMRGVASLSFSTAPTRAEFFR
jgi:hypothetical protein